MEAPQSVPDLIAAARATAKISEDRISALLADTAAQAADPDAVSVAVVALEAVTIDTFAAFEARMQHHFRRGPFSRKLRNLLVEAGEVDLADRIYQHYLAVNVLKHGLGASYRELRGIPESPFVLRHPDGIDQTATRVGLIDVKVPGFFDGLATAILDAHAFLEAR